MASLFRYYNNSPEVIRFAALMYVRYPLSLRNVADLLFERGIDVCHETIRQWWGAVRSGVCERDPEKAARRFQSLPLSARNFELSLPSNSANWRMFAASVLPSASPLVQDFLRLSAGGA